MSLKTQDKDSYDALWIFGMTSKWQNKFLGKLLVNNFRELSKYRERPYPWDIGQAIGTV